MENSAIFRSVDVLASEHLIAVFFHLCFPRERQKRLQNGLGDKVLGEIDEHGDVRPARRIVLLGEFGKSLRILSEQVLEDDLGVFGVVQLLQLLP